MAASLAFLQTATSSADASEYTFSSQSFGTAASDRVILVAVHARKLGSGSPSVSVTVGGVSATQADGTWNNAANQNASFLFYAEVPTGTSGDVVVTFGSGVLRAGIGMWRATGIDSTPFDSESDGFGAVTLAIDVEAGGIAVAAGTHTATTGSMSWSNITEDYDEQIAGEAARQGGASDEYATAQTALDVTPTFSGSDTVGVVASWSEATGGGVSGGSTANIDVDATGAGTKAVSGGSTASVSVDTTGAGSKQASGGAESNLTVDALGDGTKTGSGGSEATVTVTTTGGGQPVGGGQGGSVASITVATTGAGTRSVSGGSEANVTIDASGDGSKHGFGGSESDITVGNPTGVLPTPITVSGSISTISIPGSIETTSVPGSV